MHKEFEILLGIGRDFKILHHCVVGHQWYCSDKRHATIL